MSKSLPFTVLAAALIIAGCGGNNFDKNQANRRTNVRGIYYVTVTAPTGQHVPCIILSKEYSEGDQHAIGISCDWGRGG